MLNFVSNPLIGVIEPLAIWNGIWPYLMMLLGFTLIIFVHELGHFAVAKWADVRVEKFAIGFGREIFGFTRGETRYSFNILPLGGYVKMLGQEDFDDKTLELKTQNDPRSFVNKPVGHRMAVVSAGVIMNVIFAGLLFMIVFLAGIDVVGPRVASVEPDSPAAKAGLLPGDSIYKVNGESVLEFDEIMMAIFLSKPHEPIEFFVHRNGENVGPIFIKPEYRQPENTRQIQRQIIGMKPGITREIVAVGPDLDPSDPRHPHVGDRLIEVDGAEVTDDNVNSMAEILAHTNRPVLVERKDPEKPDDPSTRMEVLIPPQLALYPSDPRDSSSISVLGLTPLAQFDFVDEKSRAFLAGIETGDTVLHWDDRPHPGSAEIAASIRDNPERDIPFKVRRANGKPYDGVVRPKRNPRGPATIQAICRGLGADSTPDGPKAKFTQVRPHGITDRAGIEVNDVILKVGDVENPTATVFNRIIREATDRPVPIAVQRPDGKTIRTTLTPIAPGSIDATHSLVAADLLQVGDIVPTINGRPSPAAQAGIPAGARISKVDGQLVSQWRELINAFRTAAGKSVQLSYVKGKDPEQTVTFHVPHCLHTLLGVGPEAKIVRIAGRENVISNTRGKEELSVRYHEGTRTILTELIGQDGVPVEFRANPLAPVETKSIDIREDMVDSWLGRVAFAPSVRLDAEMMILRGENALDAVRIGVHKTYYFLVQVYQVLHRMIFSRSVSVDAMSGPLGIVNLGGKLARTDITRFLFFLAMISANLAVINFLPLPIVDGGLMVFLLIEKIKGSPVSIRVQVATQMIGIFLIIGAFILVTYNDAVRMWG
ncbi:MAG: RIP metalloprotease RseP [Planctomycetota bacterium]